MHYAGKKGFISIAQKKRSEPSINLLQLSSLVEKLTREKKLQTENNVPFVNLQELGYSKLLGAGAISQAVRIRVGSCSENALRKLKEAGGEAVTDKSET
jgi:ribosomal protein L15